MPRFYSSLFKRELEFPAESPPPGRMSLSALDADMTENCNLRCSYCFKGELALRRKMTLETAQQMVRWIVAHSNGTNHLVISLLGGEPMMAFDLLKQWMPFAFNYCQQRGKNLQVGITTNLTLFTEEHLAFFRFWKIGIHASLDGIPCVQDSCRVFANGRGSSAVVERNLPRIFQAWRTVHARSTIVPETLPHLAESYQYFLEKGFLKVAFALANSEKWNASECLADLRLQIRKVLDIYFNAMRRDNRYYVLTMVDRFVRSQREPRQNHHCGAGRGLLHVDVEGFLWPCHRFNGIEPREELVIGHVNGGFHPARRDALLAINPITDIKAPCETCDAVRYCGCPCIAANWQTNGDLFSPGEGYCKAQQVIYREIKTYMERAAAESPEFYKQLIDWIFNYKW